MIQSHHVNQDGFSLIEVMVALVIIAISMLALGSLLIGNIQSSFQSEKRIDYTGLAHSAMNNMAATVKAGGVGYTQTAAQTALAAQMGGVPNVTSTVSLNPTTTIQGTTVITVTFSWDYKGNAKTITLRSAVVSE